MDLRTNQEAMGVQSRYSSVYGSQMFKKKETFEETDIKGNNNLYNSFKTETNINHGHDSDSLFQVNCSNTKKLEVDNSLFSYSSFKKAMDLRIHNRTLDGGRRTIFEDAEHFAKNHCYKLLPISFEQVDETIIQSEHNYSLFSLTSESEADEDCSRMMDYSRIKEKNYKRRRTKFRQGGDGQELLGGETKDGVDSPTVFSDQRKIFAGEPERPNASLDLVAEHLPAVQPLDLSAATPVQDEKTGSPLRERPSSISEENVREAKKFVQVDSVKENLNSEMNGIRVTITRPDEKENYQPCDLFLNDIARLVPWLIDKDCLEVDILDRTCDDQDEFRKHRLYYVISESTWRLFQRTNERVILTNDRSLGPPLRKVEKVEKPSYLVFDQFSLAKCLAEYCQEIGGCFEYTCVEEKKEFERAKEEDAERAEKANEKTELSRKDDVAEEKSKMGDEGSAEKRSKEKPDVSESSKQEEEEVSKESVLGENEASPKALETDGETSEKAGISVPSFRKEVSLAEKEGVTEVKSTTESLEADEKVVTRKREKNPKEKGTERQRKGADSKKKFLVRPKPKNFRMTTRSKSTSESETSQNSDKRTSGKESRKRGGSAHGRTEPPNKLKKSVDSEDSRRKTRSGKILEERKQEKPTGSKKKGAGSEGGRKKEAERRGGGEEQEAGRTLRSQRLRQRGKGEPAPPSRGKR